MGVRVRQRKDKPGTWWVFVDHKGQRMKKYFGSDKNAAMAFAEIFSAQLTLADLQGEAMPLLQPHQAIPTVGDYVTRWLRTYAQVHCKPTTATGYRQLVERHLLPVLGARRLDQVTRADIKQLIAALITNGLKKQTVHNILTPLKEAYHHAMDEGIVGTNPVARTGRLTRSREDRRLHIQPLTAEEVQRLLAKAHEHDPALYPILLCAVRTGMRQGEIIGLKWDDVDVSSGVIEVRRAIVQRRESTPKNHQYRRVDMTPQLTETLRALRQMRSLEAGMRGVVVPDWVFLSAAWTRWDESHLRRVFYHCLEQAELRRVRFHDLRHTYASLLGAAGAPPKYVQEQLGHSSIQVTMDTYSHLFPSGNRQWVARLDEGGKTLHAAPHPHPAPMVEERK